MLTAGTWITKNGSVIVLSGKKTPDGRYLSEKWMIGQYESIAYWPVSGAPSYSNPEMKIEEKIEIPIPIELPKGFQFARNSFRRIQLRQPTIGEWYLPLTPTLELFNHGRACQCNSGTTFNNKSSLGSKRLIVEPISPTEMKEEKEKVVKKYEKILAEPILNDQPGLPKRLAKYWITEPAVTIGGALAKSFRYVLLVSIVSGAATAVVKPDIAKRFIPRFSINVELPEAMK